MSCLLFADELMSASYKNIACVGTDLGDGVGCGGGAEAWGVGVVVGRGVVGGLIKNFVQFVLAQKTSKRDVH